MTTPLISVVIPTYNRPDALGRCLRALAQQSYSGCWQVIVVDDGGDHSLTALIYSFKERLDIDLLKQTNQGPAAARNLGAQHACGQFLAFLDDDCEPSVEWLESFVPHFKPGVLLGGRTENKLEMNLYSEASQCLVFYLYACFRNTPWWFFTSNNFAMDRETFITLGGFDTSFHTSAGEDRAFCVFWAHQGRSLSYVPRARVDHSHHLTLFSFCKLHVKYGQAASHFRAKLREWGVKPVPAELSFYIGVLKFAYQQPHYSARRKLGVSLLLAMSQVCTFCGAVSGSSKYPPATPV